MKYTNEADFESLCSVTDEVIKIGNDPEFRANFTPSQLAKVDSDLKDLASLRDEAVAKRASEATAQRVPSDQPTPTPTRERGPRFYADADSLFDSCGPQRPDTQLIAIAVAKDCVEGITKVLRKYYPGPNADEGLHALLGTFVILMHQTAPSPEVASDLIRGASNDLRHVADGLIEPPHEGVAPDDMPVVSFRS